MRNNVVDMHQSEKGHKDISKALGLQGATIRVIICKLRKLGKVIKLPRSEKKRRPIKINPRAQQRIIQEVIKEPRTTSNEFN